MTDPSQDPSSFESGRTLAERMISQFDIDVGEEECQREAVRKTIARAIRSESKNDSERYLRWASEHSLFIDLQREVDN